MDFVIPWVMLVAFLASLVLPVVAVVGIVTYVRRTRRLEAELDDASPHAALMDQLDQVHLRLDALSARLARLEEGQRLDRGPPEPTLTGGLTGEGPAE